MSRQIFGIHNIQKYNLFPEDRRGSFPDPSNPDREKNDLNVGKRIDSLTRGPQSWTWLPLFEMKNMLIIMMMLSTCLLLTRGPKGHISCTWVQCASILTDQPGRKFLFTQPEKHKLGRRRWDLASCQVSLNSVQGFQRSRKCPSQSEARAAILFFRSAQKTQTW